MPKLSISLNEDVYQLVLAEKGFDETISKTIARLITAGSKYEVVVTRELKEKEAQ